MIRLRDDWHESDDTRSPETRSTRTLLKPASEACCCAGARMRLSVTRQKPRMSTVLPTVVQTQVQCCRRGEREKVILSRILQDVHNEGAKRSGADNTRPILV